MGVDIFNFSFNHSIAEIRELAGNKITLLGNIPPRDILANGMAEDVKKAVRQLVNSLEGKSHIILSCGGGMPPGVSTENIKAFLTAVR
jgi:uroporphyrinogen-III decarboxylase